MLTVGNDMAAVERRLRAGELACPSCGAWLGPWGRARPRMLRDDGAVRWRVRPLRAICAGCGVTQVLLPVDCLVRRADVVAVIGAGLTRAAAGWGHRRIAVELGRAASTVRGWLRRFRSRAGPLRLAFTEVVRAVAPDPVMPEAAGSALADAVAAIGAAAVAVARRWGQAVLTVSPWQVAAALTSGGLLGPGTSVEWINTTRPW